MSAVPDFLRTAWTPELWPTFVLLTARIGGLMSTAPLWSMTAMPMRLRSAITLLVALLLLPGAAPVPAPAEVLDFPLPVLTEMAIGSAIGLVAAVIVHAATMAGEVLSLQMGLSLGPAYSPVPEMQVSGVAPFVSLMALFVYVAVGGHLMMLEGLAASLEALPPGGAIDFAGAAPLVAAAGQMFTCAVTIAGPVMATLLLVNVALAILSRAVPQINAMLLSFPVTIGVGLLMLAASLPLVSSTTARWFSAVPTQMQRVFDTLAP